MSDSEKPMDTPKDQENKQILVTVQPDGTAIIPLVDAEGNRLELRTEEGFVLEPAIQRYQQTIDGPPASKDQLFSKACNNDEVTINSWAKQWIEQCAANASKYDFVGQSVMTVAGKEAYKPVICAGSGPSLKKNARFLVPYYQKCFNPAKMNETWWEKKGGRQDIRIVSCLHNFGMFEDMGVMGPDDYYLNLDAGEITIREVFEGGKKSQDYYWDATKDRTLVAYTSSHPELLNKWKGKILFFTVAPSPLIQPEISKYLDTSKTPCFNVGGNALGACLYMAKAVLGCGPVVFVGADFSFDQTQKFHGWDSPYDKQFSGVDSCVDVYGRKTYTWPSYFGFKCWFDFMSMGGKGNNGQLFINCTEGGILGAYPEGNIKSIIQMKLSDCLHLFTFHKQMKEATEKSRDFVRLLF